MQRVGTLWRSGARGKLTILLIALLGVCIVCSGLGSLTPRQTPPTASQPGPTTAPAVAQAPATPAPPAPPAASAPS